MLAASITVVEGAAGTGDQDANLLADGQILFADPDLGGNTLSTGALAAIAPTMDIVVQSTGTITFNDLEGVLTLQTAEGHSATFSTNTAGGGATTFASQTNTLATSGGSLSFSAGTHLSLGGLAAPQLTLFAATGISANSSAALVEATNTSAGDIRLTQAAAPAQSLTTMGLGIRNLALGGSILVTNLGESINVAATSPVQSNNGDITLSALDFNIFGAINSGNSPTTLANSPSGRTIDLGRNTPGSIGLTDLELDQVTASVLRVGSPTAGNIDITAVITQAGAGYGTLSLRSGQNIFGLQGGITADDLAVQAAFVLMEQNDISNLAGIGTSLFRFMNYSDLNVGTVDGMVGITSTSPFSSSVELYARVAGTTLTVSQPILSHIGGVFLRFDDMTINAAITGTAGTAMSGFVGRVQLTPLTSQLPIDVGAAFEGAALHLSDAELDLVNADRFLHLGEDFRNAGDIVISGPLTQMGSGYTNLRLETRGAIVDATGGEETSITVTSLALVAGSGMGVADSIDTTISNLAFKNTGGAINIFNMGPLTIAAVALLPNSTNTGTTTTITATSPLTFAVNTTTTGDTTYTAGETDDAIAFADDLTVNAGVTVSVSAGNLTLQAGDRILLDGGSTVSASGTVTLNMGFGDLDGVGGGTIRGTIDSGTGVPAAIGGAGHDGLHVEFTAGANLPRGLDFQGGDHLVDSLTVSDVGGMAAHTYDINGARVIRDGTTTITTSNGVETTWVDGGNLSDTFHVTPDVSTRIFISLHGSTGSPGDTLDVDLTGTTNPFLRSNGFSGSYRFANRQEVIFSRIATLHEEVDLAITNTDGQDTAEPGSTVTYTIVVSNAGAIGVGAAYVTDFFPIHLAGLIGVSYTSVASGGATGNRAAGTGFITDLLDLPIGASVTYTATGTLWPNASGNLTNAATVTFPIDANATPGNNTATDTTRVENPNLYAVGADAGGGPHVRVFLGPAAGEKFGFYAYDPNFTGGVRVALGDVTGDGMPDIITAAGPGGGPHVRVFDGRTGNPVPGLIGSFYAYHDNFGGVFVASADFNGDGFADVVTGSGAGAGAGRHIRVFSGADGSELFGFVDMSKLDGDVRVAAGDIDGDGTPDVISAFGPGAFPSVVRVFSGATQQPLSGAHGDILPYPGFQGGVYVASGDVDGDGRDDIITGAGAGADRTSKPSVASMAASSPASLPTTQGSREACA